MKSNRLIDRHPWLFVLLAFLLLAGAWSALISIAVKHAPQAVELSNKIPSGDH